LKVIETNPFFEVRYSEIRCLPLQVFKYMIHFIVDEEKETVTIIAVISTYLDPNKNWL
jgi:hypothetical protein